MSLVLPLRNVSLLARGLLMRTELPLCEFFLFSFSKILSLQEFYRALPRRSFCREMAGFSSFPRFFHLIAIFVKGM